MPTISSKVQTAGYTDFARKKKNFEQMKVNVSQNDGK